MRPVPMQVPHWPARGLYGDCYRCCFASILELSAEEVPHFCHDAPGGEVMFQRATEWLRTRGLWLVTLPCDGTMSPAQVLKIVADYNPGVYYIFSGCSKPGLGHAVVCLGDSVVFDPAADRPGVVLPCDNGVYFVEFIASAVALA